MEAVQENSSIKRTFQQPVIAKIGIYSELYNCFIEIIMGADKGGAAGWTTYNRPVESAQSKRANCKISVTNTLAMVSTNGVVRSHITSTASISGDSNWAFFAFYPSCLDVDLKDVYWFEAWTRCNSTSTRLVRSTNCWIESCSGRMVINSPA